MRAGGPESWCRSRPVRRAAQRGHRVTLIEQADALGGRLRMLAALPGRGRWRLAIESFARTAERAGVDIRLDCTATTEDLSAADVAVIATGASWDRSGFSAYRPERDAIPGADGAHVLDIATAIGRVLADPAALGRRVVILDETQDALPAGLAELLAAAGVAVEILTPHLFFGDALARSYDLGFVMKRVTALGVAITPQHFVERIEPGAVHAYGIWDNAPRPIDGVDTVVLSQSRRPVDVLYRAAHGAHRALSRIGDALAPRAIEAVICEGEKTGREL